MNVLHLRPAELAFTGLRPNIHPPTWGSILRFGSVSDFPLCLARGGCVTPFEYLPFYPLIFGYGRWVLGRVLTHRYVYFAGAFVYCFGSLICLGLRGGCLLWGWDPWRAPAGNYLYFGLAGGRLIWDRVVSWAFVAVFAVANPTCLL